MTGKSNLLQYFLYLLSRIQKKIKIVSVLNSTVDSSSKIEAGSKFVFSSMKRNSFCGYDCLILNADIGSFCSIADEVCIGGAKHPMHFVSTSPVFLSHKDSVKRKYAHHVYSDMPRSHIGHDVWIGYRAIIRSGITVGNGAVVGMGSVVTRDVEPYTVVAGNPAKVVSRRFSVEISQRLLLSEWWNMSDDELSQFAPLFIDPESFLNSRGL